MNIETYRFGRVTIDPNHIVSFQDGILGFEHLKRFAIILCEGTEPIQWLQAVDDPEISLPIINPFVIKNDYELDVDDEELRSISMPTIEDILIVNVMVLPQDLRNATINLSAPILINIKTKQGRQIVMEYSGADSLRYPAFDALAAYFVEQERQAQKANKDQEKEQADAGID